MGNILEQLNSEMAASVESVRRGLVEIRNGRGAGAGTIWHSDGLIITNAHVLGQHGLKVVLPDQRSFPARVIAFDRERDIAALSIEATGLPTVEVGDSRLLKPGEWVMAIGHPWGVLGAATAGVVIGQGSDLPELPGSGREWIAVSLHMRPGHSGGPLVDINGRLVGINTMITGPEVGMAIPVHVVKEFLRQVRADTREAASRKSTSEYV
jgi:serine protease Do